MKPIWSEGLFIAQQHFQIQDEYHEQRLNQRLAAVVRHDWGITRLEVDMPALAAEQFRILRMHAIFPSGLVVACGEGYPVPAPPQRSFGSMLGAGAEGLVVSLAIPEGGASRPLVSRGLEADADRRFARAVRSVTDCNTGVGEQDVQWALPNLQLRFGAEEKAGEESLKIARVVRQANGEAGLQDTFVPPCLHVEVSPFLRSGLARIFNLAHSRQQALSAARAKRGSAVAFHTDAAESFWLLHTLNSWLPLLKHLASSPRVHPEEVYRALASFYGSLCTFSEAADPTSVLPFEMFNLGVVFEELFAQVTGLLQGEIRRGYVEIELRRRTGDGMYLGQLQDPALLGRDLFVAVQANLSEAVVRERVPGVLKVAAWSDIGAVISSARTGLVVDVEYNPSAALPLKAGLCFFRIRKEGPLWDNIAASKTLALYLPGDKTWAGTALALYALERRGASGAS